MLGRRTFPSVRRNNIEYIGRRISRRAHAGPFRRHWSCAVYAPIQRIEREAADAIIHDLSKMPIAIPRAGSQLTCCISFQTRAKAANGAKLLSRQANLGCMVMRVLITGAAGKIGTALRNGLAGRYPLLRLCDTRDLGIARSGEETATADLTDPASATRVTAGMDAVVHLAGVAHEDSWERILPNNIAATYNLFEAARESGVKRILFASSNHTVGYYPARREVGIDVPPRPDSRYAVSKVLGEALGRLYADKFGVSVICLRIGSFRRAPESRRQLATWISPRDMVQLAIRSLETPNIHFAVYYGISANRRRRLTDDAATVIGFKPMDDAEAYASQFADEAGDPHSPAELFHGGPYCMTDFSGDPGRIK